MSLASFLIPRRGRYNIVGNAWTEAKPPWASFFAVPAVSRPPANYKTSLCFGFLTCKMRLK